MAKTVVGLFDNSSDARATLEDLQSAGFNSADVSFVANNGSGEYGNESGHTTEAEAGAGFGATGGSVLGGLTGLLVGLGALIIPGVGPAIGAGSLITALGSTALGAGIGAAAGGLVGALVGAGIPEEDANVYAEGVRRGGALITVTTESDQQAQQAADIMNRHNVADIDQRGGEYRSGGWSRFDHSAQPYSTSATSTASFGSSSTGTANYTSGSTTNYNTTNTVGTTNTDEIVVPVTEEQLQVGKREVEGGGVRVRAHTEEIPVNEQVTLRDERVQIDRQAVDRPVSATDTAFQETSFEVRERDEEAVISKQARVVEEVVINKDVIERTETIQDSVRRTDVEIEEIPGQTTTTGYTTTASTTGTTGTTGTNEGIIERGAEGLQSGAEKLTGKDLNNSGSTGDRDTRNNY